MVDKDLAVKAEEGLSRLEVPPTTPTEIALRPEDIQPWERQVGEDSRAFEAFAVYRDLPTRNRTFTQVAEILYPGTTWAHKTIAQWSKQYNWLGRVEVWERELDRVHLRGQQETVYSMSQRHVEYARKLQTVGIKALEKLQKIIESAKEDNLPDLSAADIRLLIVEGAKLERLAKDLKLDESKEGQSGGSPLSRLSDAELQKLVDFAGRITAGAQSTQPD